ncbi:MULTISPECIES: endolytic transglycosylase MltG [Sulfurimonas]|uniref:endolytic transglycosylase MltG n=1 Tax=Sulfurimonas TaxID=202746 RepID=UPI00126424B4|nr:endolytic transglycosylase MltG [Sulfurimonas indica]
MKDKKLTIVTYVVEIILITLLSFIYYLVQPIKTPKVLYIPKGSINQIISQLQDKNYDVCKLDAFILRFVGSPQSGWINMTKELNTKADFLYKLTTAKAALHDITIIPGETTYVFLDQLAKNLGLDRVKLQEEFEKQSPVKEGVFVPNTYKIPVGISEKELISLLLKISLKKMKAISIKIFGSYNEKKWFRYIVIASIIQKESANNKEMPLVSSVIYNRLKNGMKLQMDGTLNYGKYSHTKVTSKRIKQDKSIYNTYIYSGLPTVAICNVSQEAVMAAIFPAKTNYLYFMKSKNGTHDFTCNYSTHLRNIKHATK